MTATHEDTITIQILLDPPPLDALGFAAALAADVSLGGDRVKTFKTADEVDAAETAGDITTAVADALKRGLSQTPRPPSLKVISVDVTGGEDYDEALTAGVQEDPSIYAVAIDSRTAADQLLASAWAEARDKIFIMQSGDADIITSGFPAAYSTIEDSENTAGLYHDDAARFEDFSWAANRLAFDPDFKSVPWEADLKASVGYTTEIDSTEKGHLEDNNFNALLPFSTSNTYVANEGVGVNLAGRQVSEIVTKHWFKRRLQERVAATKLKYTTRGEKIPVGVEGVSIVQPIVEDLFSEGVDAGHFIEGQTQAAFPIPTAADIENNRIRGGGSAQLATGAGTFDFELIFSRQPVIEEG